MQLKPYFTFSSLVGIMVILFCIVLVFDTEKIRAVDSLIKKNEDLKTAQAQLVHTEKMASLGELTAGIAHEIQNPLNFVNNFAEVSEELCDELEEELHQGETGQVIAILKDLKQNLGKIHHHGNRADVIVKGMLLHSGNNGKEKQPTDLNALLDEYLRLAYHGLRAKDKSFAAEFELKADPTVGRVRVSPQDMGRVFLNLFNNAFYATQQKKQQAHGQHKPKVTVATEIVGKTIKIKVKDNGTGIPEKVKNKIFQPFFTTKPTGQGTGLGLSLSYDIVTKGHGGEIGVDSVEGEYTEFTVCLPADLIETGSLATGAGKTTNNRVG